MSNDEKVEEPVISFMEWVKETFGITPIESMIYPGTCMILGLSGGRPVLGSIDDFRSLSTVLVRGVLGYAEVPAKGPDGQPGIAGQMGPIFHTIGIVDQMFFDMNGMYFLNYESTRDKQLSLDYERNMKEIMASYSGIVLATPNQMPRGGLGIVR
jgi:hypothetical protein